jgi:hypothetical protein
MKKLIIDTDLLTTILGFLTSFLILLHQLNYISTDVLSFSSALVTFIFGYFTNKVRIKKEVSKKTKTDIETIELES